MKGAALLIRNYHAKKSPFDINRSASRVHFCKATINIVTLFKQRGSQCAFRTLECALGEYASANGTDFGLAGDNRPHSGRCLAHNFDIIAIRIKNIGCVVRLMVVATYSGRTVAFPTSL
ncbi:hypothetical protein SAMN03159428_02937 [Kosakonia radicincitans]|uniref:Uncharacterized protein n=1 Tax=Kosakonia radicincitans TaxID=283686 RepID=A0AAX2ERS2_9ENTR|nr:hypothetical protein SAMN03159294_1092 [Kosakonia radicincitans]SFE90504.1 hypothetical protein SAMN03159468_03103 [Kosakonia radicincitans]SFR11109.1 hypothetical protein SAMN03159514_02134 [Kosakonia radicincitans]SFT94650.1 hypothetical protein SAMN03159428_02937 [Kosakonia radicincitans]SFX86984.1 hypothetical protein SAMN03159436_02934 [Kosakonia radicincitans]